jgi:hypothetical protein
VVSARNTALVKGEPASEHNTLLPPTIEAILEHGELLLVMPHAILTALCFAGVYITITPFVVLVPIVVKLKTGIDVFEGIPWNTFHACANCIKQLACQPRMIDHQIPPRTLHKLASKKACNMVSNNDLPIGRMIVLWHPPLVFDAV